MSFIRFMAIIWALPYTTLGLLIGLFGLCTRGSVCRRWPIEFYGGGVEWLLSGLPSDLVMAMTLGHVIPGRSEAALDISRDHELIHVRQYERWGPFPGPAYWSCSLSLWLRGKDGYRDNPFEKEAWKA